MGSAINDAALLVPADVYCVINDDILCLTYCWDDIIAKAVEETPYGVFFWKNALDMDALYPIVTEKWRAAAGQIFTNNYPFWYDDLCLVELWVMATAKEVLRVDAFIVDKPFATQRMRDLKLWQKVYTKTRPGRVKEALSIATKLGIEPNKFAAMFAEEMTKTLIALNDERLEQIERNQGEPGPPDEAYIEAKANAEKLLARLALEAA